MAIDYNALRSEIINNPASLGYKALVQSGSDNQLAALLNAPNGLFPLTRACLDANVFLSLINGAEFAAMPALNQLQVNTLAASKVITNKGLIDNALLGSPLSTTAVNTYYQKNPASRAEVLFGEGIGVTADDVAQALNGQLAPSQVQVPGMVFDDKRNSVPDIKSPTVTLTIVPSQRALNTDTGQYVLLSATDATTLATAAKNPTFTITNATPIVQPVTLK